MWLDLACYKLGLISVGFRGNVNRNQFLWVIWLLVNVRMYAFQMDRNLFTICLTVIRYTSRWFLYRHCNVGAAKICEMFFCVKRWNHVAKQARTQRHTSCREIFSSKNDVQTDLMPLRSHSGHCQSCLWADFIELSHNKAVNKSCLEDINTGYQQKCIVLRVCLWVVLS